MFLKAMKAKSKDLDPEQQKLLEKMIKETKDMIS
jgi:mRNA-degrading endonuclease RelE of RelBE toxin-antitoxin system